MKKVLIIVHQMNRGGLECRLMDILRNWNYKDIAFDIFTTSLEKGDFDEELNCLGVQIYYNPHLTLRNMVRYVDYFKKFLLEHPEYQVIHAYQDAWCGIFCKGAQKAGVCVRIAHSRTANYQCTLKDIARNIIKQPVKRYATHFLAVSKLAGIWLFGKQAFYKGQVTVWPNAIDSEKFMYDPEIRLKIRKSLKLEGKNVIMHVGNFTAAKNHTFLLNVFHSICKKNSNSTLVLVGKGNKAPYVQLAKKLNISDNVIFLDVRNDVNELLQAADIFLFPSLYEGLPGAVLEAQAAGLPCIISENITNEVKITPLVQFVSLNKSAQEWAEIVCSCVNHDRRDMHNCFVQSGFDIKVLVERMKDFYMNIYNQEVNHEFIRKNH